MGFSRRKLLIIAILTEGTALVTALLLAAYFDIKLFPLSRNLFRDIAAGTIAASLPFAVFVFMFSKSAGKIPVLASLRKTLVIDIKPVFSGLRFFDIVLISMLAGFAEELLFRGVVQAKSGIIIAGILFGLVHFITPAYAVIAAVFGFYIGYLFHVYESLLVPVQMHFIYDLGALLYLRYCVKAEE